MSAPSRTRVVNLAAFAPKARSPVVSTAFHASELQQNRTVCGQSLIKFNIPGPKTYQIQSFCNRKTTLLYYTIKIFKLILS